MHLRRKRSPPDTKGRRAGWLTGAMILLLCTPALAFAQILQGTVREIITQRAVRGMAVSLLDSRDSVLRTVTTDDKGAFRFVALPPGDYSLSLRQIGFEPMTTTPMKLVGRDTVVLAFDVMPAMTTLDTVKVSAKPRFGVTPGRTQFLEHYRAGMGLFISGAEIAASGKGVAEYVAKLPGFTDFGGGRPPPGNAAQCQNLDAELNGQKAALSTGRTRVTTRIPAQNATFCALMDEMGRRVASVDAPCVVSQVDRIGFVKRVVGTDLIVQSRSKLYTPADGSMLSEADAGSQGDVIVHLSEVIGVEFFRTPAEMPPGFRIRGNTVEAEAMISRCGHIQFWTRTAW